MRISFCIFILLLLATVPSLAQNKAKIDSLKKLGRDSLIGLAVKKLNEPGFDPSQYDRIEVKAYKDRLIVEFGLSIRFNSGKSCYYDEVSVALAGSGTGASIKGDCDNPVYYKRSASEKKKIDFVFDAINKSDEIGHIPDKKLLPGTTMEITEKAGYYYIEVSDYSTYSHYRISKVNGNISEAGHKHYARDGDETNEYEIIGK